MGTCVLGRVFGDRSQKFCKGLLYLTLQLLMQTLDVLHKVSFQVAHIGAPLQTLLGPMVQYGA